MDNISFGSSIKITSMKKFANYTSVSKKCSVNYPWTAKQSVLASNAETRDIYDCTAAGFTDGKQVLLMHICPTIKVNEKFPPIQSYIEKTINLDNPNLQAFILGSKNNNKNSPLSSDIFQNFLDLTKKHNIPTSYFRGGNFTHHIAYSSKKDEWIIGSDLLNGISKDVFITPESFCKKAFDSFELNELDSLSWK